MSKPLEREFELRERREATREQRQRWRQAERRQRSERSSEHYLPQLKRMFNADGQ